MHHPVINVLRGTVEHGVMDSVHGIITESAVCQEKEEGVKSGVKFGVIYKVLPLCINFHNQLKKVWNSKF